MRASTTWMAVASLLAVAVLVLGGCGSDSPPKATARPPATASPPATSQPAAGAAARPFADAIDKLARLAQLVESRDFRGALQVAKDLDKAVDAAMPALKTRDAAVSKALETAMHELEESLEGSSPVTDKVKAAIADAKAQLEKAVAALK